MSEGLANGAVDPISALLIAEGLRSVALVDDVFDPLDQLELQPAERDDLWTRLQANDAAVAELENIGYQVSEPNELTGVVLVAFNARRTECPAFDSIWQASLVGGRVESGRGQLTRLEQHLARELGLQVRTFGTNSPTADLIAMETQLLFIDWYLGDDTPAAVDAAVTKVKDILSHWPPDKPKPLIVLMSNKAGLREQAEEFCRRSGILRGMFYPVPKGELTDLFKLRMLMQLFAMSLSAGRRIQAFVDALYTKFDDVKKEFIDGISDLTLNDYAYIQSLSLQDDGQPLGDYLLWLFSAYFGQLLFAEVLREQRADLDTMTFAQALPSPAPPSERLTELYHCALFDTSVGPVGAHPRATEGTAAAPLKQLYLTLGDVLGCQAPPGQRKRASSLVSADESERPSEGHASARNEPDLFLVINAQCDLAFTPDHDSRPVDPSRSILLLPGYLQSILDRVTDGSKPKTELYRHAGGSYRIVWDTRKVLTVPYGQFDAWKEQEGLERVSRLRLPFALEVQRAFAADLTRVGTPTMPPIYQPVVARVLRVREQDRICEATGELQDDEAAFLILTKDAQRVRQQCVLTLPLVARLKALLDERLVAMRDKLEAQGEGGNVSHLPQQIEALERALVNDREWARLLSPFNLPNPNRSEKFLNGRIQVVREKNEGDTSDSSTIAVVSLDLGAATP